MTHSSALLSSGLLPLIPSLPEQTMRAFGARAVREPPRSRRCPEQVDGSEENLYGFTAPYTDTKARSTAGRLGN
jgi:hypothetical protein